MTVTPLLHMTPEKERETEALEGCPPRMAKEHRIRLAFRRASCSACRAFDPSSGNGRCTLGYATESMKRNGQGYGVFLLRKPVEPCPRPLTYEQLFACKHRSYVKTANAQAQRPLADSDAGLKGKHGKT